MPHYHHLKNVLSISKGDRVKFRCNDSLYLTIFERYDKKKLIFSISSHHNILVNKPNILLFQSLIRANRWDFLIEKAVEFGVDDIFPLISDRCLITSLDKKKRWEIIAKSSAYQSGREKIPTIHSPINIYEAVRLSYGVKLVLDIDGQNILNMDFKDNTYSMFIGPEGGFSEKEKIFFKNNNFVFVSMSPYVLRSETAGMISAAYLSLKSSIAIV